MAEPKKKEKKEPKPRKVASGSGMHTFFKTLAWLAVGALLVMVLLGSCHNDMASTGEPNSLSSRNSSVTSGTPVVIKQNSLLGGNYIGTDSSSSRRPRVKDEPRFLQKGQWCVPIETRNKKFYGISYQGPVRIRVNNSYGEVAYFKHDGVSPTLQQTDADGHMLLDARNGNPLTVTSLGEQVYEIEYMSVDKDKQFNVTLEDLR